MFTKPLTETQIYNLKVKELKELIKFFNLHYHISGYSKMNKYNLIQNIIKHLEVVNMAITKKVDYDAESKSPYNLRNIYLGYIYPYDSAHIFKYYDEDKQFKFLQKIAILKKQGKDVRVVVQNNRLVIKIKK